MNQQLYKMKLDKIFAAAVVLLLGSQVSQAQAPARPKAADYTFKTIKEIPVTSVKNQNRSGTCWCFSALSFLESEVIKAKNLTDSTKYPDFSEMFIVRNAYHDRAIKFVRLNGHLNFAAGSGFGDVLEVIRDYGLEPQSAFSGMNYGTELPVQGELDAALKGYVEGIVKNPNRTLTPTWVKGFDGIMDAYLGEIPESFTENGVTYTPASYRDAMGINPDDYVNLSSFTHHPFYSQFIIEVEDNWRWSTCWNLPLDEFMQVIYNALENGYTVAWGGDVSEIGFTGEGLAVLPKAKKAATTGSDQERWVGKSGEAGAKAESKIPEEEEVTQESRQLGYDNKQTTDDHGMHLYGIAEDQNGTKYFLVKNSWGEAGKYKGTWYMSDAFARAKTLNVVVNKKALPKDIKKKLGIK